jgi:hypothetical protein
MNVSREGIKGDRASAYKKSAGSDIKGEWEGKRSG